MDPEASTILITGGASGIGLALAERLIAAGSTVIVCGRREEALRAAREKNPRLLTWRCDVADETARRELCAGITAEHPRLDVLINNAGVQYHLDLQQPAEFARAETELAINLAAPVHLAMLLLPHLVQRPRAAIVNVTSGLSFVPLAGVPIYCASKAALHSFTLSLRQQLSGTAVEVIEIIPPAVDTDLGGPGLHTFGVPLGEFADAAMAGLAAGANEIAYGFSQRASQGSRAELDAMFATLNASRH